MTTKTRIIHGPEGLPISVQIKPDRRLRKSARWTREEDHSIILRVPPRLSDDNLERLLKNVAKQLQRQRRRAARRTDADLQERAVYINRRYFNGELRWESIRWVDNMLNRLGSCTNGGDTDGHIRISERISEWPQWVIDYVVAHELAHRCYPHHGPEFWAYLRSAYPQTERALGFIQGVAFARHETLNEDEIESKK